MSGWQDRLRALKRLCLRRGGIVGAIESIQAGLDVVLVVGAECRRLSDLAKGRIIWRALRICHERSIDDFTFPALLARRAKAYKEAYGITDRDGAFHCQSLR